MHIMTFASGTTGSVLSSTGPIIFIGHTIEQIPQRVQSSWSTKRVVISCPSFPDHSFRVPVKFFLSRPVLFGTWRTTKIRGGSPVFQGDTGTRLPGAPKIIYSGNTSEICLQRNQRIEGIDRWEEVNENGDTVVAKVARGMVSGEVMMSGGIPWTREMIPAVI
jgi:hypothetical protein